MSKYNLLWESIRKDGRSQIKLCFEEIDHIAKIKIDHSFLNYKMELTQYGYQVRKISFREKTIVFDKIN